MTLLPLASYAAPSLQLVHFKKDKTDKVPFTIDQKDSIAIEANGFKQQCTFTKGKFYPSEKGVIWSYSLQCLIGNQRVSTNLVCPSAPGSGIALHFEDTKTKDTWSIIADCE